MAAPQPTPTSSSSTCRRGHLRTPEYSDGPEPVVYFAQAGGADGPIKIGCTIGNARARMNEIRREWSEPRWGEVLNMELLATFPGYERAEGRVHDYFAADRLPHEETRRYGMPHGYEWFRPSRVLLDFIDCLRREVPQDPGVGYGEGHRCAGTTAKGEPCRAWISEAATYCHVHEGVSDTCDRPGCEKARRAGRGLCWSHYYIWRMYVQGCHPRPEGPPMFGRRAEPGTLAVPAT